MTYFKTVDQALAGRASLGTSTFQLEGLVVPHTISQPNPTTVDFVIADGIEAMEGNGPLQGELRRLSRIVLADDPVAADATCARLMGLDPRLISHIEEAGRFLGNMDQNRITMLGEGMPRNTVPFRVIPQFQNLQSRA